MPLAPLPGLAFEDPAHAEVAFPEKYLAVEVRLPSGAIEIHNAHLGLLPVGRKTAMEFGCDRKAVDPRRIIDLARDFLFIDVNDY